MELYCNGRWWGSLMQYHYATPWAEARLRPADEVAFARSCRVSEFLAVLEILEDDLTEAEEEAEYERRLAQLGLTESDVAQFHNSRWEILSDHPDRQGAITLYEMSRDGWIRWRWG